MIKKLISIVVPVYNVEKYVSKCIESILMQDYVNFELLLVDDGSTDKSGLICEKYKKQDKRIRIFHKENGGLSDARNYGIDRAKGELITFIDSDDTIKTNYLTLLIKALNEEQADIVQANMYTSQSKIKEENRSKRVYSGEEAFEQLMMFKDVKVYAWAKLYRISLFKENKLKYPIGKIMEDSFTTFKLLLNSNRVVCLNDKLYFYRQRNDSIMNRSFNRKNLDLLQAPNEISLYLESNNFEDEKAFLDYYSVRIDCNIYNNIIASNIYNNSDLIEIRRNLINRLKKYKKESLDIKYQIMLIGITRFTWIYNKLIRLLR